MKAKKKLSLDTWRGYDEAFAGAHKTLSEGGLAVLPTDTLYGLCGNAMDEKAVEKVFEAKKRDSRPVAIIVSGLEMLCGLAEVGRDEAMLLQCLFPGPFTVLLKPKRAFPKRIAHDGKLGVRFPHFVFTTNLVRSLGFPLTATSANVSGGKPPKRLADVPPSIIKAAGVAVDSGVTRCAEASTVIDLTGGKPVIIRRGARHAEAEELIKDFVSRKKA
ncbi:MAG: L-threonylcarbamoyladenylate synthase [Candidatus ainarchaeum sp.]|nr:L-threonylcarbamoyladenylate synthase [Candidatus ainarchaeum sp.]